MVCIRVWERFGPIGNVLWHFEKQKT